MGCLSRSRGEGGGISSLMLEGRSSPSTLVHCDEFRARVVEVSRNIFAGLGNGTPMKSILSSEAWRRHKRRIPRHARIDSPGALHHVVCRGMERRQRFRDNQDGRSLVDRLNRVLKETSTSGLIFPYDSPADSGIGRDAGTGSDKEPGVLVVVRGPVPAGR